MMAYFSNSTEGDILQSQCDRCPLGDKPCPVMSVQLLFNYDQIGNAKLKEAMEQLVDKKGMCQLFPLLKENGTVADPLAWMDAS
jgi:hypothetical protein